jgi:hypothetical protein
MPRQGWLPDPDSAWAIRLRRPGWGFLRAAGSAQGRPCAGKKGRRTPPCGPPSLLRRARERGSGWCQDSVLSRRSLGNSPLSQRPLPPWVGPRASRGSGRPPTPHQLRGPTPRTRGAQARSLRQRKLHRSNPANTGRSQRTATVRERMSTPAPAQVPAGPKERNEPRP